MNATVKTALLLIVLIMSSCISKKKYMALETDLQTAHKQLAVCEDRANDHRRDFENCEKQRLLLLNDISSAKSANEMRQEQISDLKDQISDIRQQRDKQVEQVGDLTVLSQSASENIKETLNQLDGKDKYINFLQAAKTKADSMNLALAVNLKGVLSQGISDEDVNIQVDKTVVFINISDKMLFQSGSARINARANEVLGKISKVIQSRPGLEVMVEGYTDNQPIRKPGIEDNWDLSVKRATAVVRTLQNDFNVNPNRLIAAGRGEYNELASNDTPEGRSINRRTRIILLPKLNEFYDLLNPDKVPE